MRRTATCLFMLTLLASSISVGAKNVPLRYTRRLPRVDRVELQKVDSLVSCVGEPLKRNLGFLLHLLV